MYAFHRIIAGIISGLAMVALLSHPAIPQEQTTATYGDWTLLCNKRAEAAGKPACEVGQQLAVPAETKRPTLIGYVAIARSGRPPTNTVAVKLPLGVSLPTNAVVSGLVGKLQIVLAYRYCLADGCVAMASIDEGQLALLRGSNEPMNIAFDVIQDDATRRVELRVSLSGLTAALKALEALQ